MTTLTIGLPNYGSAVGVRGWQRFLDLASDMERIGFDRLAVVDHVVMGPNTTEYRWGPFRGEVDGPWCEPLTILAAIAARTARIRLATGILIAPLRPATLLAKIAATLDTISGGRLDLGVGVGWQRAEYTSMGLPFEDRGRMLDETIAACRVLWSDSPASFDSEYVSFDQIWCEPKPVQQPLPVWFSGTLTPRNLRRIVTLGDGWLPIMDASIETIASGRERLQTAWTNALRPGSPEIRVTLPIVRDARRVVDVAMTIAGAAPLLSAGVTDVRLALDSLVAPDRLDHAGDILAPFVCAFAEMIRHHRNPALDDRAVRRASRR